MLFPFTVGLYLLRLGCVSRVSVFVLGLGVVMSLSRGAMLSIFSLLLVLFLGQRSMKKVFVVLWLFLLLFLLFFSYHVGLFEKEFSLIESRVLDHGGGVSARLNSLFEGWWVFSDSLKTILIGSGLGWFSGVEILNPHNSYLRILYEMGLVGFLSFLLLLIYFIILSFRSFLRRDPLPMAVLSSLLVGSVTNDYYLTKEFWFILALVFFLVAQDRHSPHY